MGDIAEAAKTLTPELSEWYRELHKIPEIGMEQPNTQKFIINELSKLGLDEIKHGDFGIVAKLKGKLPGPVIALRADMDALPIREENDLPYSSQNGYMHACGHDAHSAMMIGTAKLLSERREKLKGEVRFIFQLGEEVLQGAKAVLNSGMLDGIDFIIGMHTSTIMWPAEKPGMIGWRYDGIMAGPDEMHVLFKGKGGHGAAPHLGVDPIMMACEAITHLQRIISREVDPLEPIVITVGSIHAGEAANVIPDSCLIKLTIRTFSNQTREFAVKRAIEIVQDTAKEMRGTAEVSFPIGCPPVVNDNELVDKLSKVVSNELGNDMISEMKRPIMGGEDFSFYLEKYKGMFFFHSSRFCDDRDMPHHNPRFQVNTETLWTGCAAMASLVLQ